MLDICLILQLLKDIKLSTDEVVIYQVPLLVVCYFANKYYDSTKSKAHTRATGCC